MHGLLLMFAFHVGGSNGQVGDRWFSADKAKHFFTAAFVQSASFGGFRAVGMGKHDALIGATIVSGGVSVGKELYDFRPGGDPSLKDLTWDAAGIAVMTALLRRTAP